MSRLLPYGASGPGAQERQCDLRGRHGEKKTLHMHFATDDEAGQRETPRPPARGSRAARRQRLRRKRVVLRLLRIIHVMGQLVNRRTINTTPPIRANAPAPNAPTKNSALA